MNVLQWIALIGGIIGLSGLSVGYIKKHRNK